MRKNLYWWHKQISRIWPRRNTLVYGGDFIHPSRLVRSEVPRNQWKSSIKSLTKSCYVEHATKKKKRVNEAAHCLAKAAIHQSPSNVNRIISN